MSSFTGLKYHVANFYDDSGAFIGSHVFKRSFKMGLPEKTFTYKKRTYFIDPSSSRSASCSFPWIADIYSYTYHFDNPFPFTFNRSVAPIMRSDDLQDQLGSKVLRDLNRVRQGGLSDLLTLKNITIFIVIVAVIYFFMNGGSFNA